MPGLLVPCNYSVLNCCFLLLNKPMSEKVQRRRVGRGGEGVAGTSGINHVETTKASRRGLKTTFEPRCPQLPIAAANL